MQLLDQTLSYQYATPSDLTATSRIALILIPFAVWM